MKGSGGADRVVDIEGACGCELLGLNGDAPTGAQRPGGDMSVPLLDKARQAAGRISRKHRERAQVEYRRSLVHRFFIREADNAL